ncbi:class I SAM-dependent methyltransferase [Anaerobacillus sp. CMMVII]|uniref:class I SAM-dependent methyltransferase n=1 Tax=Anaerobacillus sp. CMMVII TaxID=2755588 RepID=UPI0021B71C6B|nr:class I SAM-dependent methyltransferase [Anaerobacillus sp. CMMVII]MCT8139356.1 class I SAM-dependent methyltransferase [Anaerobacillus sp. CMMVII]
MDFYQQLSKYYDLIFPLNSQSIAFIRERIGEGAVLDIAAGTGNHALALANLGLNVTATDLDKNMVAIIEEKALKNQVSLTAVSLAMEQLDQLKDKRYSTIIVLGNSLVHLDNMTMLTEVLSNIHNLLTKSGKLLIQIVNYDRILKEGVTELPMITREKEELTFRRTYKHVDKKIKFCGQLTIGEEILKNEVYLLPITSKQLVDVLAQVGFQEINLYGSFKGEPFETHSPALIVEATKK